MGHHLCHSRECLGCTQDSDSHGGFFGWLAVLHAGTECCAQCSAAAHVWQAALQHAPALLCPAARVAGHLTAWQCCMLACLCWLEMQPMSCSVAWCLCAYGKQHLDMLKPHIPPYLSTAVICVQGTALAFFAVDLGKTITVAATDKALALLRGEAALAHRAAMVGVQLVKQARQEVKPAAEVRGPTLFPVCPVQC